MSNPKPGNPDIQLQHSGRLSIGSGNGGLERITLKSSQASAEIYPHGAHVTGFQLAEQPPLLFLSRLSPFAPGKAIRGGVPICLPWFGSRPGSPLGHGFARITRWDILGSRDLPQGGVAVRFRLPENSASTGWPKFNAEFEVAVTDRLEMELSVENQSNQPLEYEDCLHTYFHVGNIAQVTVTGLESAFYLDKTDQNARKQEGREPIRILRETNRIYPETPGSIEIRDATLRRVIRIDRTGSRSTVLWNPWTTQLMPDFDPAEHASMVCVEAGNVGSDRIVLAPGETHRLRVALSSSPLSGAERL
ncbi:MAG: D-hexose-6-phosphate mutarotase [Verrucomicrobiota bacterium]